MAKVFRYNKFYFYETYGKCEFWIKQLLNQYVWLTVYLVKGRIIANGNEGQYEKKIISGNSSYTDVSICLPEYFWS